MAVGGQRDPHPLRRGDDPCDRLPATGGCRLSHRSGDGGDGQQQQDDDEQAGTTGRQPAPRQPPPLHCRVWAARAVNHNDPATSLVRRQLIGEARVVRRGLRGWGVAALAAALVSCTSSAAEQPAGRPGADHRRGRHRGTGRHQGLLVPRWRRPTCPSPASKHSSSPTGPPSWAARPAAPGAWCKRWRRSVRSTGATDAAAARRIAAGLAGLPGAARLVCAWTRAAVEPQDPVRPGWCREPGSSARRGPRPSATSRPAASPAAG